jgi:hypothetical protein
MKVIEKWPREAVVACVYRALLESVSEGAHGTMRSHPFNDVFFAAEEREESRAHGQVTGNNK